MLPQEPVIGLAARESGAVDAALLARAHADGLAVLDIADRVGLGVLQRNQRHDHIERCRVGQVLVVGDDVVQHRAVDLQIVVALLEGHAKYVALLNGLGLIRRVDLHDIVAALALAL